MKEVLQIWPAEGGLTELHRTSVELSRPIMSHQGRIHWLGAATSGAFPAVCRLINCRNQLDRRLAIWLISGRAMLEPVPRGLETRSSARNRKEHIEPMLFKRTKCTLETVWQARWLRASFVAPLTVTIFHSADSQCSLTPLLRWLLWRHHNSLEFLLFCSISLTASRLKMQRASANRKREAWTHLRPR